MASAAGGADLVGRQRGGLFVQIDDGHVGSGPGQGHRASAADPHGTAGDQRLLARQIE